MRARAAGAREELRARRTFMRAIGVRHRRRPVPRQLQPDAIRLSYFSAILVVLERAAELVRSRVFPAARVMVEQHADELARHDAADDLSAAFDTLSQDLFDTFTPSRIASLVRPIADRTSEFQKAQFARQMKAVLGVDVLGAEPWLAPRMEAFTRENVALIKSIPTTYFGDLEKQISRGMREGLRWEELAPELEERYGVAESRAKLIARDQVGKWFGELNAERQKDLGVEKFVWRTAKDNRVRESHAELEGETFSWDDLPTVDGELGTAPGQPINCRCEAEPVLDDLVEEATSGEPAAEVTPAEEAVAPSEEGPSLELVEPPEAEPLRWQPAATPLQAVTQLEALTGARALQGAEYKDASKRFGRQAFTLSRATVEKRRITTADQTAYLNRVGTTIADLKSRFPEIGRVLEGGDVRFLPGASPSQGMAAYAVNARTGALTTPYHVSFGPLAEEGYAKQMADYTARFGVRWTIGGNAVESNVRHELAHLVHFKTKLELQPLMDEISQQAGVRGVRTWVRLNVSEYGASKDAETFAELASMMTDPNYVRGTLPAGIESFVLKALGTA